MVVSRMSTTAPYTYRIFCCEIGGLKLFASSNIYVLSFGMKHVCSTEPVCLRYDRE